MQTPLNQRGYVVLEALSSIGTFILSGLEQFPEENIAIFVYVVGTLIALWCWYRLMTRLPKVLGCMLWILVFAILATPTISEGPNSALAPAISGLLFGVLAKDQMLIWANLALILFVAGVGFVLAFCWSKHISKMRSEG